MYGTLHEINNKMFQDSIFERCFLIILLNRFLVNFPDVDDIICINIL